MFLSAALSLETILATCLKNEAFPIYPVNKCE